MLRVQMKGRGDGKEKDISLSSVEKERGAALKRWEYVSWR